MWHFIIDLWLHFNLTNATNYSPELMKLFMPKLNNSGKKNPVRACYCNLLSRINQTGPYSIEVKAFSITVWSQAQFMSAARGKGWMNRWLCTSKDLCKQNAALYLEKKYTHRDQLQQEALHCLRHAASIFS